MITADTRLANALAAIPSVATHVQAVQTFGG
jgi:hypothetical protein